jgi:hypothetical protein
LLLTFDDGDQRDGADLSKRSSDAKIGQPPGVPLGGSTVGGDVSDDGFGKPDHKAFQLAVFAF